MSSSTERNVSSSLAALAVENGIYKSDEILPLLDLFVTIITLDNIKPTEQISRPTQFHPSTSNYAIPHDLPHCRHCCQRRCSSRGRRIECSEGFSHQVPA